MKFRIITILYSVEVRAPKWKISINFIFLAKQYLVYSFRDTFFDNELVGSITIDAFKLDTSRVIFPNNNATPVSGK